jgi:hypothetical protein
MEELLLDLAFLPLLMLSYNMGKTSRWSSSSFGWQWQWQQRWFFWGGDWVDKDRRLKMVKNWKQFLFKFHL